MSVGDINVVGVGEVEKMEEEGEGVGCILCRGQNHDHHLERKQWNAHEGASPRETMSD